MEGPEFGLLHYRVLTVYRGSDGEATKALYQDLEQLGRHGVIAMNLLRAQKNSERAKVYRGGIQGRGSYRGMAYDRKQWALDNLVRELAADSCGLTWGWQIDAAQDVHRWVLYVELPTGQVSFHTAARGVGPDFPGKWDQVRGASAGRVCRHAATLLHDAWVAARVARGLPCSLPDAIEARP